MPLLSQPPQPVPTEPPYSQPPYPVPPPSRRGEKLAIAIGLSLVAVILIGGVGGTYWYSGRAVDSLEVTCMTVRSEITGSQSCWQTASDGSLYVQASLSSRTRSVSVAMLVDTGASMSMAPFELAGQLGINLYSGSRGTFCGISGCTQAYVHTVTLEVDGLPVVSVSIAIATSSSVPYLLGRQDFLDRFDLQVDQSARTFCLSDRTVPAGAVRLTMGVYNPSIVGVTSTWRITETFSGTAVTVSDVETFQVPARTTVYPEFEFEYTYTQLTQLQNVNTARVTITEQYSVLLYGFQRSSSSTVNLQESQQTAQEFPEC